VTSKSICRSSRQSSVEPDWEEAHMTWKGLYPPTVLALGFVLTHPAEKAQQTNTPKPVGQTSQTHGATTPKKHAAHPQPGNAVNLPANAVTNQGVPLVTGSASKVPHRPFTITKQVDSSSPQLARGGSGKKGTANGGASAGSPGFSDLTGVSQSKDGNVSNMRVGSDQQPQIVPKEQPAGGSRVSAQAATLPGNAVQATPTNPPKRKKPAAPSHQP
jgi:hypothetical protein